MMMVPEKYIDALMISIVCIQVISICLLLCMLWFALKYGSTKRKPRPQRIAKAPEEKKVRDSKLPKVVSHLPELDYQRERDQR